jgi:hypothetical protein
MSQITNKKNVNTTKIMYICRRFNINLFNIDLNEKNYTFSFYITDFIFMRQR